MVSNYRLIYKLEFQKKIMTGNVSYSKKFEVFVAILTMLLRRRESRNTNIKY